MSTDNPLLDTITRHQERSDSNTSDAAINAHETLDDLMYTVSHNGRVTALNEAITKIRALIKAWSQMADEYTACNDAVSAATALALRHAIKGADELAFELLSSVDKKS